MVFHGADGRDGAHDDEGGPLIIIPILQKVNHGFRHIDAVICIYLHLFFNLIVGEIYEGADVAGASIKYKHTDVQILKLARDVCFVIFDCVHLGEIRNNTLCLKLFITGPTLKVDFSELLHNLILTPRYNTNIKSFPCQLLAHGETDAVRAASHDCPTAFEGAILSSILLVYSVLALATWADIVAPEAR